MDWVIKESAWDVVGLGEEEDNSHFIAPSACNSLVDCKNGDDLLNDLRLGTLGDVQDGAMDRSKERKGSPSLQLPIELKKTCAVTHTKKVSCSVDGCLSDLSKCREYHRRHKVCERHAKIPVVIIEGREQRFCQQCSRFHSLGEFDDVKRSCRKRLDCHNRRRRKPQPESLYMSSQGFLSDYRGGSWLQFSGPQAYGSSRSTKGIDISWPGNNNKNQLHSSQAFSGTDKECLSLTATNTVKEIYKKREVAISRKLVNSNFNSARNCSHLNVFDKLTHMEESRCALSLLSTNQTQAVRTIRSPLSAQQDIFYLTQPTDTNLQFNELYPYSYPRVMDEKRMGALVTPDGSNIFDCSTDEISPLF